MMDNNEPLGSNDTKEESAAQSDAPTENETVTAPVQEELSEQEENKLLDESDGDEFAARYHSAKEREMQKLAREMEERNAPKKTKKEKAKQAFKIILVVGLFALSFGIMFGISKYVVGENPQSFMSMLKNSFRYEYFLALIGVVLFYILMESLKYSYLLKISTGKWRLKNGIKTFFLGKYYDGITPLGTGGQPFQIYYLHKRNVPAGVATAVPLVKYIVTTFVFGFVSIVMLAIVPGYFRNSQASSALSITTMTIAWISLFCNLLVPTVMLFVSAFPKAGKKLIAGFIRFLAKLRIVKHKYSTMKKYVYEVNEYRNALKLLIKKWYMLIPLVIISLFAVVAYLSLPFFAVISIAGKSVAPSWRLLIDIWCLADLSYYTASLVPTPGNSGASEMASILVFSTVKQISSVASWVVLTWRFSNFYLYILIGVCMSAFSLIRTAVRKRRARRKA